MLKMSVKRQQEISSLMKRHGLYRIN